MDRKRNTDDYGEPLDPQKGALCSSLRGEYCPEVTNNGAKTHNLFNYFPNHAQESIVAHANDRFNKNKSPHLMKAALDDRTLKYLSKQNPHALGVKPMKSTVLPKPSTTDMAAQSLFDDNGLFGADSLKFVKSKTIKTKKKKTTTTTTTNKVADDSEIESDESLKNDQLPTESAAVNAAAEDEYEDVEIEFYSNFDDEELGETVDSIITQLVASYLDNESGEEVDVSQIFANELMEEVTLDESTVAEMNDLLNLFTQTQTIESEQIDEDGVSNLSSKKSENAEDGDVKMFAFKFVVESENENDERRRDDQNDIVAV